MRRQNKTNFAFKILFTLLILLTSAATTVNAQLPGSCAKNNCHPMAICIDLATNSYSCKCLVGHRDMNSEHPGQQCVSMLGFNECAREEDNACSENARCIDMPFEYKCQCLPGYRDASPKGTVPGSKCVPAVVRKH